MARTSRDSAGYFLTNADIFSSYMYLDSRPSNKKSAAYLDLVPHRFAPEPPFQDGSAQTNAVPKKETDRDE